MAQQGLTADGSASPDDLGKKDIKAGLGIKFEDLPTFAFARDKDGKKIMNKLVYNHKPGPLVPKHIDPKKEGNFQLLKPRAQSYAQMVWEDLAKDASITVDRNGRPISRLDRILGRQQVNLRARQRGEAQEAKDYWDRATGPVRREHFLEYKQHMEADSEALRFMIFDLAAKASQHRKENAQQVEVIKQLKEELRKSQIAVGTGTSAKKVNDGASSWLHHLTTAKSWAPKDFGGINQEGLKTARRQDHAQAGTFLYGDLADQLLEVQMNMKISRCQIAWMRQDWSEMLTLATEALILSKKLEYAPLFGVAYFYMAIATWQQVHNVPPDESTHAQKQRAREYVQQAKQCIGFYKEGESVVDWVRTMGVEKVRSRASIDGSPPELIQSPQLSSLSSVPGAVLSSVSSVPYPVVPSTSRARLSSSLTSSDFGGKMPQGEHPPVFDDTSEEEGRGFESSPLDDSPGPRVLIIRNP